MDKAQVLGTKRGIGASRAVTRAVTRELTLADYDDLLFLYAELMGELPVLVGEAGRDRFREILTHPGTEIIGAVADGPLGEGDRTGSANGSSTQIVSVATLHVLANLTHGGRPYALIENVVTLPSWRGLGLARLVMQHAQNLAWRQNAYKIMLLTGQQSGARGFYEGLGYQSDEKHAMTMRRAPLRSTD